MVSNSVTLKDGLPVSISKGLVQPEKSRPAKRGCSDKSQPKPVCFACASSSYGFLFMIAVSPVLVRASILPRKTSGRDKPSSLLIDTRGFMKVAAVVVAAGKSERMGENKLLIEFCGRPLLEHVLAVLSASRVDEIVVVVGHKPWQLDSILRNRRARLRVVVNEKYEEGMALSFKEGLRTVMSADAVFLVLADQPLLDAEFLNKMIRRLETGSGVSIVSPIYKGKKGHPVLFSKETYRSILDLPRNGTLREVLARYAGSLAFLKGDRWTMTDIDTPDDIGRARRLMRDQK